VRGSKRHEDEKKNEAAKALAALKTKSGITKA